jgi:hypothetical protein
MTTRRAPALRRPAGVLVALALALVTLAGCGDDDTSATDAGSDPTTSASTPSESATPTESATAEPEPAGPSCDEVWVDGAKLPGGYQDCYAADGKRMKANGRYCEFGKPLVTYADSFWAVPGGPVHEVEGALLDDPDYTQALRKCSG